MVECCVCAHTRAPACDSLGRLRDGALEVIVPEERHHIVAPAGDAQRAEPGSLGVLSRHLEEHGDVLGLFGAKIRSECSNYKARVVHLEDGEKPFYQVTSMRDLNSQPSQQNWPHPSCNTDIIINMIF